MNKKPEPQQTTTVYQNKQQTPNKQQTTNAKQQT